ncbi:alpha/beta hydrolase [Chloroflexota bacterium]
MRRHITFPCGDITLEGCWHFPETDSDFPAVVVCHPHPLNGGSMSANVIFKICEALSQRGIVALRFNFRGVGMSSGTFGNGIAEQDDARAALAVVMAAPNIDTTRLGLAGYSFGGGIAVPVAAQESKVKLLALIAPALTDSANQLLKAYPRPVFLIIGENDTMIPSELVRQHLSNNAGPRYGEILPGADHFWQGYDVQAAEKVADFFSAGFKD